VTATRCLQIYYKEHNTHVTSEEEPEATCFWLKACCAKKKRKNWLFGCRMPRKGLCFSVLWSHVVSYRAANFLAWHHCSEEHPLHFESRQTSYVPELKILTIGTFKIIYVRILNKSRTLLTWKLNYKLLNATELTPWKFHAVHKRMYQQTYNFC
jgi:hypothetical protein